MMNTAWFLCLKRKNSVDFFFWHLWFSFDISKEEFKVAQTHQVPEFDPKYVVLCGKENKRCYYSECLEEKFENYEIGHTQISSNFEKKLFYNIICHLIRITTNFE